MRDQLTVLTVAYLVVTVGFAVAAAMARRLAPAANTGCVVAQILLGVGAVVDLVAISRGARPADLATHLGYIGASLFIFPLLLQRPASHNKSGSHPSHQRVWHAVQAVAAGTLVVVVLRQAGTAASQR
ncbi:MAG: hypothetical protein ACRCTR_03495 [Actinomycetota bacterium]